MVEAEELTVAEINEAQQKLDALRLSKAAMVRRYDTALDLAEAAVAALWARWRGLHVATSKLPPVAAE